jgi:UDP-N-acetylmuramate-alanine ligase
MKMENSKLIFYKNTKFIEKFKKEDGKAIHFIGLGGIGMSGLAKFLIELGYRVSGSDIKESLLTSSIVAQ